MPPTALSELHATASTPDGQASATIRGRDLVTVTLAPGYFDQASASDLEWQLARLARLLFAARMKAYFRARSTDFGYEVRGESRAISARDRVYVERRSAIEAIGGAGTAVEVRAIGMEHWTVTIDRQQLAGMDEQQLCAAAGRAAGELVASQLAQARRLKLELHEPSALR